MFVFFKSDFLGILILYPFYYDSSPIRPIHFYIRDVTGNNYRSRFSMHLLAIGYCCSLHNCKTEISNFTNIIIINCPQCVLHIV